VFERFTDAARQAVVLAQEWAVEKRHPAVTTAHLLVGVAATGAGTAAAALAELEIPAERLERSALAVRPAGSEAPVGHLPFTPGAKKALELSLREALRLDDRDIDTGHLVLGLLRGGGDDLVPVLADAGVDGVQLRRVTERLLAERPREGRRHPREPDQLERIEVLLSDVLARLERIERRLDRS
jgi:ATP-dependent Clp protease ATP-binding subunit ClpC